jgi:CRP/FNR family cyclic AMP-dependent transcriptional regulator
MTDQDVLLNKYGREFPTGTVLFKDGDTQSKEMYVIHSGKVKISKKMGERETVLAVIGQGEFFGEMAILNNKPRSATAEVVEDSKLLVIDPKTFETMIKGNAEVAFRMIKKLADRLRETDRKIELLMIKDNSSRVIHILERFIEDIGEEKDNGICVPITINELTSKSGVKIYYVNEIIEKLKKAKIISVSPEEIFVHDVSKLKQFLEFLILKEQFGDLD